MTQKHSKSCQDILVLWLYLMTDLIGLIVSFAMFTDTI